MAKKWLQLILITFLAVNVSGCVAVLLGGAAGAGVLWYKGKLQEELDAPLNDVYNATILAMRNLELPIEDRQKDTMSAKVKAAFADGKQVWIDLLYLTESATRVSIRVGRMGDETRSRRILDTMRENLSK